MLVLNLNFGVTLSALLLMARTTQTQNAVRLGMWFSFSEVQCSTACCIFNGLFLQAMNHSQH